MDTQPEIKQHQHHMRLAIFAIVGFLVILTWGVFAISKNLEEQKVTIQSKASEYNEDDIYIGNNLISRDVIVPGSEVIDPELQGRNNNSCGAPCNSDRDCNTAEGLVCNGVAGDRKCRLKEFAENTCPQNATVNNQCQCVYSENIPCESCGKLCNSSQDCDEGLTCGSPGDAQRAPICYKPDPETGAALSCGETYCGIREIRIEPRKYIDPAEDPNSGGSGGRRLSCDEACDPRRGSHDRCKTMGCMSQLCERVCFERGISDNQCQQCLSVNPIPTSTPRPLP